MRLKQADLSFFLISLAVFTYQSVLGPIFSCLLTGLWQNWVLIPSFFGLTIGALIFLKFFKHLTSDKPVLEIFNFVCFFLVFLFLVGSYKYIDGRILELARMQNAPIVEVLIGPILFFVKPVLVFFLSVPFVSFGLLLAQRFLRNQEPKKTIILDFMGLALGGLVAVVGLESLSVNFILSLLVVLSGAGAALLIRHRLFKIILAIVTLAFVTAIQTTPIGRNLNIVARDFKSTKKIEEVDSRWSSFARVQLLNVSDSYSSYKIMAIGEGVGHAYVQSYANEKAPVNRRAMVDVALTMNPKKVLILFAGAASEAMDFHFRKGHDIETTSVELNPAIQKILLNQTDLHFEKFLQNEPTRYVVSDNRYFIETNKDLYDTIIFSWSGATVANYSGAILHTTQYSFTIESIRKTLGHLKENGIILFCGANKINLLYILKLINAEQNLSSAELGRRVAVLSNRQDNYWNGGWDPFVMIYKNGAFSAGDIETLKAGEFKGVESNIPLEVILSPFEAKYPGMKAYKELIDAEDLPTVLTHFEKSYGITPSLATDDHPYIHQVVSAWEVLNPRDFFKVSWNSQQQLDVGAVVLALIFLLIAAWLGSLTRQNRLFGEPSFLNFMSWAPLSTCLSGFLMYKAILYFGQPTYAFLIVHLSLQTGTVLSSLNQPVNSSGRKNTGIYYAFGLLFFAGTVIFEKTEYFSSQLFGLNHLVLMIIFILASGLLSYVVSGYYLSIFIQKFGDEPGSQLKEKMLVTWVAETFLSGVSMVIFIKLTEALGLTIAAAALVFLSLVLLLLAYVAKTVKKVGA